VSDDGPGLPPLDDDADDGPPAPITDFDMDLMDRLQTVRLIVAGHMHQLVDTCGFDGDGAVEGALRLHGHLIDRIFHRIAALPPVPDPER